MDILLEIFGYVGTFLILFSMMMTSVTKLRWLNLSGSVISIIYGAIHGTWPVVFLNTGMVLINAVQLYRLHKQKGN
ncbi:MAG: YgjV family protein [Oscillospiraceae bacterium]|nr:YgjV family protein [Oscillospiraceae bacterium]